MRTRRDFDDLVNELTVTLRFGDENISSSSIARKVTFYTGRPKKVSHYQSSSLNHIKNGQRGYIFHQF